MKKLLSIIGVMGLTVTPAFSVVACGSDKGDKDENNNDAIKYFDNDTFKNYFQNNFNLLNFNITSDTINKIKNDCLAKILQDSNLNEAAQDEIINHIVISFGYDNDSFINTNEISSTDYFTLLKGNVTVKIVGSSNYQGSYSYVFDNRISMMDLKDALPDGKTLSTMFAADTDDSLDTYGKIKSAFKNFLLELQEILQDNTNKKLIDLFKKATGEKISTGDYINRLIEDTSLITVDATKLTDEYDKATDLFVTKADNSAFESGPNKFNSEFFKFDTEGSIEVSSPKKLEITNPFIAEYSSKKDNDIRYVVPRFSGSATLGQVKNEIYQALFDSILSNDSLKGSGLTVDSLDIIIANTIWIAAPGEGSDRTKYDDFYTNGGWANDSNIKSDSTTLDKMTQPDSENRNLRDFSVLIRKSNNSNITVTQNIEKGQLCSLHMFVEFPDF